MDEAWKRARIDELWEALFKLFHDPHHTSGKTRQQVAIEMLVSFQDEECLRQEARKLGAELDDDPRRRAATCFMLWQLFTLDTVSWALPNITPLVQGDWAALPSRSQLKGWLQDQIDSQMPSHGRAIDPMPLFLPRALVVELLEACNALDRGETLPMLQPSVTGRHDASWNWDAMRTRALQYVEFYRGQGQTKKKSRSLVAIATGVSSDTLRDWEASIKPTEAIGPAFEAGRIKQRREADPTYGKVGGEAADAHGLYYLRNQLAQPLSEFGRAYQDRFGRRHNPNSSAGD